MNLVFLKRHKFRIQKICINVTLESIDKTGDGVKDVCEIVYQV